MNYDGTINPVDLVTRSRFVATFWRVLREMRKDDPCISRREVFELLNSIYSDEFGEDAFPSYNAFRHSHEFLRQS